MPVTERTTSRRRSRVTDDPRELDDFEALKRRREARKAFIVAAPEFAAELADLSDVDLLRVGATYYAAQADEQRYLNHPRTPKSHRPVVLPVVHWYCEKLRSAAGQWVERRGFGEMSPKRRQGIARDLRERADRLQSIREQLGPGDVVEANVFTEPRLVELEFQVYALKWCT